MFSFGLSSVISKVSVADVRHVLLCWERYFRIRIIAVVLILKYLSQQTNTWSKSSAENLKKFAKSVKN